MDSHLISLENISKTYHRKNESYKALDDVSLKIDKGEFVAVLGPSGSGKSTLMNLIGGLDKPDCGNVFVNGNNISDFNDKQMSVFRNKTIGFVFQSFNLDSTLTAWENVALPLFYAKYNRTERRELALDSLKKMELGERANHKPNELSGGQRQRVCVARAIVNNPDIILADEPTGNLDEVSTNKIMKIFSDINSLGYTILMVTHNRAQKQFVKRTLEIVDGKIYQDFN